MKTKGVILISGLICVAIALPLTVGVTSCNEHVFQQVNPIKIDTIIKSKRIDIERAADILFVIDNSGSMKEEQENLAANISSSGDNTSQCNASNFANLLSYAENVGKEDWDQAHIDIYNACGFIERLQLFKNEFHIGVITTDMNDCDSPGSGGRAPLPQKGCLQTGASDATTRVLTPGTPNLAATLSGIVRNIGIGGSPYEKGLEAAEHFLTSGHEVPAPNACGTQRDCSGDLAEFLRDKSLNTAGDEVDTKLIIIFLTDEEDCSHPDTIDEGVSGNTEKCYSNPELLTDYSHFVRFFTSLKPRPELVSMAAIAGFYNGDSGMVPSGCKLVGNATSNDCTPAHGNSVATCEHCVNEQPVCPCHPDMTCPGGTHYPATNCCQADPAERYFRVATSMYAFKIDTLCSKSFRDTMIAIADLINDPGSIDLAERPTSPQQVVVRILRAGTDESVPVPYCGTEAECRASAEGGWALVEDNSRIKFFGEWIPRPGDSIEVQYQ